MTAPPPPIEPKGPVQRFLGGAGAAVDGALFTLKAPRLRLLALVPMVLHVVLFVGLLVAAFAFVVDPLRQLLPAPDPAATGNALATVGNLVLQFVGDVLAVVVAVVGAFVGAVAVGGVIADPLYDVLSERTEELLLGHTIGTPVTVGSVVAGIVREGGATLVRLAIWGTGAVVLALLSATPAVVVAAPLSLAWTALFTAWEYLSRSLTRHTVHIGGRLNAIFSDKATFLGFGGAAMVLSALPLSAPLLVVGATRLYLARAALGHVASRLTDADRARLKEAFSSTRFLS
jgi:CysZ protein